MLLAKVFDFYVTICRKFFNFSFYYGCGYNSLYGHQPNEKLHDIPLSQSGHIYEDRDIYRFFITMFSVFQGHRVPSPVHKTECVVELKLFFLCFFMRTTNSITLRRSFQLEKWEECRGQIRNKACDTSTIYRLCRLDVCFQGLPKKKSVRVIQPTAGNNTGRLRWGISKGFIVRPSRVWEQIKRNKLINDNRHALCLFGLHPVRRVSVVQNQCSYTTQMGELKTLYFILWM